MKAVLFDVYETLIRGTRIPTSDHDASWHQVALSFGLEPRTQVRRSMDDFIQQEHERSPHPHPEVDIREFWRRLYPELEDIDTFSL
ncbi:MAG: hypothetical protein ACQKBU_02155, partial [Verrucomicrobiales bacterium]